MDGKFFRLGEAKFHVKGVTYGPFAPNAAGEHFGSLERTRGDFELIRTLGANVLRVYYVPPRWFLDLALEHGLRIVADIPWNKHICFLDTEETRREAREAVRGAAEGCARHPAILALSLVNEVPPDILRWSGAQEVAEFIDELAEIVKGVDPTCLCTFGNFPPTEYLRPQNLDFHCFNVYLHSAKPFENYVSRLQMIADAKPLVIGETGIDTLREGEETQREILGWQIEAAFRGGLAGIVVYSFTDDWHRDNRQITDWAFGLTNAAREPKPAFEEVRRRFAQAPYFPHAHSPMVSVVVASYNGERTLDLCLRSLQNLNYPHYEVILVDDGSTDRTKEIAKLYPYVRHIPHLVNKGLSVARNTGIQAAHGQIIAFTDSDCRADEDWLYYLVGDLLNSKFAGIGGHNLLPPDDSWIAASVMASPGGPAHVMLTDRIAEHIPGCNMAFYKWALEDIGGFDPLFRKAGDDVDVCWRLQQQGYEIGFSPGGFVWHYRRSTVADYLKQQRGYGEAEALLVHRHPEYFNWFGGSQWQGRIYSQAKFGVLTRAPMIYHGWFGSGFFQGLYSPAPSLTLMLLTSFEYHVLVTLPMIVIAAVLRPLGPTAAAALLLPIGVCAAAAWQAQLPRNNLHFWSRPLVAMLFFLQPIVRGWERYKGRLDAPRSRVAARETLESLSRDGKDHSFAQVEYWNERGIDRLDFLSLAQERLDKRGWPNKADSGWNTYDLEIYGSAAAHLQLVTVSEILGQGKQLLRCRLRPVWSLSAKVAFWVALGGQLLVIGLLGQSFWWLMALLVTVPLFVWRIAKEQADLQRVVSVFLDDVAAELKLKKIEPDPRAGQARPGPPG